ncbi:MAG: CoA transferase [Actinomycetota bacterium]|uniref:CoA transferase n=1 Tax=marine metagenome TaxID=408172 RepID=A0A381PZP6_9ZZZZ|nr:CoA transferase [Acidimicrobiales bacterium]MEC8922847.1 CoA transferase [Actinomycetota bacterium]MED5552380.1 CoA transferase [Actinomycetota bacterium]MEE3185980.1 CoA transferase [Actinomycetota bacterium]
MEKPLSDVTVLDLTRALAGPICGRLLSDLGARVIKIEPPDGDLTRLLVPRVDGQSPYFVQYNAGKECVSIDLHTSVGRELFLQLVPHADIVLENYRPGVMDRLGIGYDQLKEANPEVIMASVSGWGHNNSRSDQGAFASAIHAETGVTEMVARRRAEEPRNDPMSHSDTYTGLHALGAVLAALHLRVRTGEGQKVEVSMAESTLMVNDLAAIEMSGQDPAVGFKGGQNWSPVLRMANGRYVSITIDITTNDGFRYISEAMGQPELAEDPRFAIIEDRVANRDALTGVLAQFIATFEDAAAVEAAIGPSAVLAAEVRTVPELATTDWATERGAFVEIDTGRGEMVTVPQSPWRFQDVDAGVTPFAGYRGQHNREVLSDLLGLSTSELDVLEADSVISSRPPRWLRESE